MKKSYLKIVLTLSLVIIAASVLVAVNFNCNQVYAEEGTYTIQIICGEEYGSVSIAPQKELYSAGDNIKITINQADTYAYNLDIFNGTNHIEHNYEYEEGYTNVIDYTINSDVTINVTFTKTYLIQFYNYRDEYTDELTELLFSKRIRENTKIGTYPNSRPTRTVSEEYKAYYSWDFLKWAPDVDQETLVVEDMQYYGVYQKNGVTYPVTFCDYDGRIISGTYYHYGDVVKFPVDPIRESTDEYYYKFKSWGNDVQQYAVSSKSYTAKYDEIKRSYTVSASCSEGGTVGFNIDSNEFEYGTKLQLVINPNQGYKLKSIQGIELDENNEFTVLGRILIYVEFENIHTAVVDKNNDITVMIDTKFGNSFMLDISTIDNSDLNIKIDNVNIVKILNVKAKNENNEEVSVANSIIIKCPDGVDSSKISIYLYNSETKALDEIEANVENGYINFGPVELSNSIIICENISVDNTIKTAIIVMSICFSVLALALTVYCGFLVFRKKAI